MDKKYVEITEETPNYIIEGTPVSELPKEIINYYMEHDYSRKGIPLSAKTVKEIAKILEQEKIEVDLGEFGIHHISPPPTSSGTIC